MKSLPPRLDTLDGKVVAELWDWLFQGDRAFPILREELVRRHPDVSFVKYTEFPDINADEATLADTLPGLLRRVGANAVVAGVGN
jgi:hypothetical protein